MDEYISIELIMPNINDTKIVEDITTKLMLWVIILIFYCIYYINRSITYR